jgi:hypothetical protein
MGGNTPKSDLKMPVPFVPEKEKEHDKSGGKPPQINLTLDASGKTIAYPKTQV